MNERRLLLACLLIMSVSCGSSKSDAPSTMGGGGAGAAGEGGGAGAAGEGGSAGRSCDEDFSCPTFGDCALEPVADGCQRVCSIERLSLDDSEDVVFHVDSMQQMGSREDFLALECEVFEGKLSIGTPLGFEKLRAVSGDLTLSRIEDHQALSQLETVSGLLTATCAPELETLRLPSLHSVGQLLIYQCPGVVEIDLGALESVDSVLAVTLNYNLQTLHGLPSLTQVPEVNISSNPKLPQCEVDSICDSTGAELCFFADNDEQATCD